MAQMTSNLVDNALRHGDPRAPVRVSSLGEGAVVSVKVRNEGAPIPAALIPTLFDPFHRGPSTDRPRHGLGLGLYIVQQLAQAHHGTVSVESSAEGGTTFTVSLPRDLLR
jgi:signal transduction histidine kinase